jgi:hypothetical protein
MPKMKYRCKNIFCNKQIERYKSTVRNPNKVFCSTRCKNINQIGEFSGENNPNYKNGSTLKTTCKCGEDKDYRSSFCIKCRAINWNLEEVEAIVKDSQSYYEAANKLGISRTSLKEYILLNKIDINHFRPARNRKTPITDMLKINTKFRNGTLKRRLLEESLIEYKCALCAQLPIHNKKELVLQLDHINGINTDNRIENLRFLCPNCHTQTTTYTGRNRK